MAGSLANSGLSHLGEHRQFAHDLIIGQSSSDCTLRCTSLGKIPAITRT